MTTAILREKLNKIPNSAGIYIFQNAKNKPLYIGKASNLKSRLSSYLKTGDIRIRKMVELAHSLKIISTPSDIEALILESQLIKKFRPPFNIVMRDDKQYSFVMFTNEKYQKILTTHQPQNHEETIGPFTDAGALKTTLRLIRRIFPYCTCKQLHHNYCLNYHIGKCLGICCLKNQESRVIEPQGSTLKKFQGRTLNLYQKNITAIKKILSGKKSSLIKNLEKEMRQAAKNEDLEKAIELRNRISKLKRVFENARIIKHSEITKDTKSGLNNLFKIKKPIIHIEGYDISNIQGVHATGSMVSFVNGRPDKNFYRKFKIRRILPASGGFGDVQMLTQIIERRFKHHEWPFPDLILIDGGKQQLRATEAVVNPKSKTLNSKQIPIIALTKNKKHIGEKIYISGKKSPISLIKLASADRNLLLAIDSEAHRFAISYYRKLHRKLFK